MALSEALGVSRGTIREALGVLVAEGLAVRVPNKGVAVKQLSADDVRDVSRARAALEGAGVRRWTEADEHARALLRAAVEHYRAVVASTLDPATVTEAHLRIHRGLVGLAGSDRLLAASDALSSEIRLALAHLDRTRANLEQQVVEHQRLLDLLEAGDVTAALDDLDQHLTSAEASLLSATGHAAAEKPAEVVP